MKKDFDSFTLDLLTQSTYWNMNAVSMVNTLQEECSLLSHMDAERDVHRRKTKNEGCKE